MELYIKYNIDTMCKVVLQQQLDKFKINCKVSEPGYVKLRENIPMETYNAFIQSLKDFGIEIVDNQKSILVQKIKNAIIEMLYADKGMQSLKIDLPFWEVRRKLPYIVAGIFWSYFYFYWKFHYFAQNWKSKTVAFNWKPFAYRDIFHDEL